MLSATSLWLRIKDPEKPNKIDDTPRVQIGKVLSLSTHPADPRAADHAMFNVVAILVARVALSVATMLPHRCIGVATDVATDIATDVATGVATGVASLCEAATAAEGPQRRSSLEASRSRKVEGTESILVLAGNKQNADIVMIKM